MRSQIDQSIYDLFGNTLRPPVDIDALAARVGVRSICEEELLEDGRLIQRNGAASIVIRRGLPLGRRRFTVAHELAHLLLLAPEVDTIRRRQPARSAQDDVERLCDQIAASIVLPHDWVQSRYGAQPQRISTLRSVADAAGVSMAAALVRLQEVARWTRSLIRFRYVDGRWRYASAAGVPVALHRVLEFSGSARAVLTAVRNERNDIETLLPIHINGVRTVLPAEISGGKSTALALVAFPDS
jgi:hypothetical protein